MNWVMITSALMLTILPSLPKSPSNGWVRFNVTISSAKDIGPPKYYVGNDYFTRKDGHHYIGSSTYVCETIQKVKLKFGELTPEYSPAPPDDHPEDDLSPLCLAGEMKVFQGQLGTAQWIV
jgi:hypothetical protein